MYIESYFIELIIIIMHQLDLKMDALIERRIHLNFQTPIKIPCHNHSHSAQPNVLSYEARISQFDAHCTNPTQRKAWKI